MKNKLVLLFLGLLLTTVCFGATYKFSDFPVTANISPTASGYDYIPLIQRPDLSSDWTNYRMTPWALFSQANASINASMVTNNYHASVNITGELTVTQGSIISNGYDASIGYGIYSKYGAYIDGSAGAPTVIGGKLYALSDFDVAGNSQFDGMVNIDGVATVSTVNSHYLTTSIGSNFSGNNNFINGLTIHGTEPTYGYGTLIDNKLRVDNEAHVNSLRVDNGASDGMAYIKYDLTVSRDLTVVGDMTADTIWGTSIGADNLIVASATTLNTLYVPTINTNYLKGTVTTSNYASTTNYAVTANYALLSSTANVTLSLPTNAVTDNYHIVSSRLTANIQFSPTLYGTNTYAPLIISGYEGNRVGSAAGMRAINIEDIQMGNTVGGSVFRGINLANIRGNGSMYGLCINDMTTSGALLGLGMLSLIGGSNVNGVYLQTVSASNNGTASGFEATTIEATTGNAYGFKVDHVTSNLGIAYGLKIGNVGGGAGSYGIYNESGLYSVGGSLQLSGTNYNAFSGTTTNIYTNTNDGLLSTYGMQINDASDLFSNTALYLNTTKTGSTGSYTQKINNVGTTNTDVGLYVSMGSSTALAIDVSEGATDLQETTIRTTLNASTIINLAPQLSTPNATTGNMFYSIPRNKLLIYDGSTWQGAW